MLTPYVTETDVQFNTYGIDFVAIFKFLYEKISDGDWYDFIDTIFWWWSVYSVVAVMLSLLFFAGFIYSKIRVAQISDMEQAALRAAEKTWANKYAQPDSRNSRWDIIQKRVSENNPESWRIAIIEADILLDETLSNAGYVGQSLGEKLRGANPQSFTTIQDAWNAHKVRNDIAHVGSDFILTQKRAQETLTQFERVFREFGVV